MTDEMLSEVVLPKENKIETVKHRKFDPEIPKTKAFDKQRKVKEIMEKNPHIGTREAMRMAGYSESSINDSGTRMRLSNRNMFMKMLEDKIPDEMIAEKHLALLNAEVRVKKYIKGDKVEEYAYPDTVAHSKALDMLYKIKGIYSPEEHKISTTGLENKSDDELDELLAEDYEMIERHKKYKKNAIEIK